MLFRLYLLSALTQISVASFAPYLQIVLRNKGYSYSLVGVITSIAQAFAIIGPLVISSLSDRKGKTKPFLIIASLLSLLFAVPLYLSSNVAFVIVSCSLMHFFFWALNPLSDAFINRSLKGENYRYGTIRAVGTLSYTTALTLFALTAFPNEGDNRSILLSFTFFILLNTVFLFLQKEDRNGRGGEKRKAFSFSWFSKSYYMFMALVALTRIGESVVEKMLSSYMTEVLNLGSSFTLFVSIGAFFEFVSMILFGRLLRKKKVTPLFMLFLSAVALTLRLLLYLIPNIYVFAFAQTLHGLTFGACHVAATSFTAANVKAEHYEVGMSIYWALATNLPELLGTLTGGFIIDSYGYNALFFSYAFFPLIAAIGIVILRKRIQSSSVE